MRKILWMMAGLCVVIGVTGCSQTQYVAHVAKQIPISNEVKNQNVGYFKVGRPYTIKGVRYYPQESYTHSETGIASWYGPNFHGKQTANGEIFDKFELTAAHRTLQMPSIIRATNLDNGRSLILRVNDRGPFAHSRVLDVSERAAELLGFKHQGTTRIKVQVLGEQSRQVAAMAKRGEDTRGFEVALNNGQKPAPEARTVIPQAEPLQKIRLTNVDSSIPPSATGQQFPAPKPELSPDLAHAAPRIFVQAGSFSSEENALQLNSRLSNLGQSRVYLTRVNDQPFYRVRLGPYNDEGQAQQIANSLMAQGHHQTKLIRY